MGNIHLTVGQYNVVYTFRHGFFRHFTKMGQCFLQSGFPFCNLKQHREFDRFEAFVPDITKNIQLCIAQNRVVQAYHFTMTFTGCQNIHADCSDIFRQ